MSTVADQSSSVIDASASAGEPALQSNRSLYVGGLSDDLTPVTLRAALVPFGPIKSIDVPMDYSKGKHKGFAFVEYEDPADAAEAIYNMDGAELMGRTLTVNLAHAASQVKLGSTKAVWSNDEWFQRHVGDKDRIEKEEKERKDAADAATMKDKMVVQ